jgi:preprotein translocase subunit YajC
MPVVIVIVILYFILIRPQRKKDKERKAMLEEVAKNDRIVTIGGIHGVVKNVTEREVTLLIDEKRDVTIKLNRTAIYKIDRGGSEGELEKS